MVAKKHYDGSKKINAAGALKHLVFLRKIQRKSRQIVNYYGDCVLLRRSIFNTIVYRCDTPLHVTPFREVCAPQNGAMPSLVYDPTCLAQSPTTLETRKYEKNAKPIRANRFADKRESPDSCESFQGFRIFCQSRFGG